MAENTDLSKTILLSKEKVLWHRGQIYFQHFYPIFFYRRILTQHMYTVYIINTWCFVLIWQSYSKSWRKGLHNCYIRLFLHVHGLPESTSVLDILWKGESTLYNTSDYFWSNHLKIIILYVLTETAAVFYFQLQKHAPILHR